MAFWDKWKKQPREANPSSDDIQPAKQAEEQDAPLPEELLWLLDAPMFVDQKQIEAFYDAVLRPDYEGASLTLSDSVVKGTKVVGETTVGAVIPWLAKAEAKVGGEATRSHEVGKETTLREVSNPYRHLLALAIHYATSNNDRLVLVRADGTAFCGGGEIGLEWTQDDFIQKSPRALVLIDLPPGTRLIPAALELERGKVLPVFELFAKKLEERSSATPPAYPGSGSPPAAREEYWQWFVDHYNDRDALETVEGTMEQDQKIAWIDFRVPLKVDRGPMMHLHIASRCEYETGAFAYNFISRGFKHGVRMVGTLKTEPDLNVVAIFER